MWAQPCNALLMSEREWIDHDSAPITVDELRQALAALPGDMLVMAVCPENMPETAHRIINVVSYEVRPTRYQSGQDRFLITASAPRGRYQR